MYGTLLDQKVFESLVQNTMPMLWEHITKMIFNYQLFHYRGFIIILVFNAISFAFRILDIFFHARTKTLFQVALAILKQNGEELLQTEDDGTFISIIKRLFSYFRPVCSP